MRNFYILLSMQIVLNFYISPLSIFYISVLLSWLIFYFEFLVLFQSPSLRHYTYHHSLSSGLTLSLFLSLNYLNYTGPSLQAC